MAKKFYRKVTDLSQVSKNMAMIDDMMKKTTRNGEKQGIVPTLREYQRLLNRLKGINFTKVRNKFPAGGGPQEGGAPKPGGWPP